MRSRADWVSSPPGPTISALDVSSRLAIERGFIVSESGFYWRQSMSEPTIIYTITDEAPALATRSLLPIIDAFTDSVGVPVETRDISLAARIIAAFPEKLTAAQAQSDALAELGTLVSTPDVNIIKLPNISASIPQLIAAISELQSHGYDLPDYPEEPKNTADKEINARYAKALGSAVNPVLREGNSDRRVAGPVKEYAKKHPHSMGSWSKDSLTRVAHMTDGDFYSSEQSAVIDNAGNVRIEFVTANGDVSVLKEHTPVLEGEVIDAAVMSCEALRQFFAAETENARKQGVLLSLHLKATMMKVSDPIIFGHCRQRLFTRMSSEKYADVFEQIWASTQTTVSATFRKAN